VVQEKVLEAIDSDMLAVYAVWEPILKPDNERSSRKAATLFPDRRVRNYWTDSQAVGEAFQIPLGLTTEPAWDVYLVYSPKAKWEGDIPPRPDYFMHQLGGRLPDSQSLDGSKLASEIQRILR
jgi:hypothetical protein